jgi:hypothetical protein
LSHGKRDGAAKALCPASNQYGLAFQISHAGIVKEGTANTVGAGFLEDFGNLFTIICHAQQVPIMVGKNESP